MLAERHELALQIAVLAKLHPEFTVSELAAALGWPPLFIINAVKEGVAMELFTNDTEKDTIELTVANPLHQAELGSFGIEVGRLADEILYAIATANKEENDLSFEQLQWAWLRGVPVAHIELAVELLETLELIASYKMNDPYDEDSVYTFLTLIVNRDARWGVKQFKPRPKSAKKRQKKERGGQ